MSSYQAADFDGICDIAVLTSLYPEHADWHLSIDKLLPRQDQSVAPQPLPHHPRRRHGRGGQRRSLRRFLVGDEMRHRCPRRRYLGRAPAYRAGAQSAISPDRTTDPICAPRWRWRKRSGLDPAAALAPPQILRPAAPPAGARLKRRAAVCRRQHIDDPGIDDRRARPFMPAVTVTVILGGYDRGLTTAS